MRKILIFSIAYYPLVGGAEVAVKEITNRLPALGWDMITLRLDKKLLKFEKVGNINVYRVSGPKLFFPITACIKATQLHKKNKYDAIWSIMAAYAGFAALFFKLSHPKIPFLLTLQEGDSEEHILKRVGIFYPLWKKIFGKADYIQAISSYLADFGKKYGAKCPVDVIPNGVDVYKFQNPNDKLQINFKLPNDKLLITTSRLVKKNAIDDAIKALQYLPGNIKFLILGTGPLESKLKLQTTNYKLQTRTKFLGYIDHSEIPKYLAIADIFIRPSLSEGMGNSFIEAMAAGIPVIATSVGGIPDFLKDGETGLFCEVHNPQSISEKVKILLENQELRNKIIINAKEMAVKNYDWDLIAEKMKNIFEKLCVS
ncbi:glycosyltransferase family 4 protein [Patescibacteria group bacterium]|nr:glycosyltransferase family 4 protein [Patescibacteria group bacterium]MBU2219305.1 glycosyltransferase family 4 protein [Patescibacteria group bacterium]